MNSGNPYNQDLKAAAANISTAAGDSAQISNTSWQQQIGTLNDAYNKSQSQLKDYMGQAVQAGEPWAQTGLKAYQTYVNQFNPADAQQNLQNFMQSAGVRSLFGDAQNGTDAFQNFQKSTDYQFQYNQAMQAAQQAASAGGYLDSPQMMDAMQQNAQGLASSTFNNYAGLMQNAYGQYQSGLQAASQLGVNAMQGNQQIQAGLGQALANNTSQWGENQATLNQWNATNAMNSRLAQGQAWANYHLVNAGMEAPAAQSMVQSNMQSNAMIKG